MVFKRCFVVLFLLLCASCGGGVESESVTAVEKTPKEEVKAYLEQVAAKGAQGSEIGAMMESLNKLGQTDPAIAESLKKQAMALMSSGPSKDQTAVKAKAKAMLAELEKAK